MKKLKRYTALTVTVIISLLIMNITVFAGDGSNLLYSEGMLNQVSTDTATAYDNMTLKESNLISILHEKGDIHTDNLVAKRMSMDDAEQFILNTDNIDLSESDIYYVENKKDSIIERKILADVAVAASGNSGENTKNGSSSRVVASCVIGYETITKNTVEYVKGKYFGGKIVSQPNSSVISSITGTYHEVGPYITASGSSGIASDYTTSASFDVSKHTSLQKKNVSRSRYFNSEVSSAAVNAKYSVSGTVNGYKFSFDVVAEAF